MNRGATAEIDLDAIAHNFRIVKRITDNRPVIAVVKADAYGHGAVDVSRTLVKEGASYLAVAYTAEAVELRRAGIEAPIIVLFDKSDIQSYFEYNLIPVVHDVQTVLRFSEEARKRGCCISMHVKVDTGMGRLGFNSGDIAEEIADITRMGYIEVTGLMSHFSEADLSDRSYANIQLERFNNIRDALVKKGIKPSMCHMANSAATLSFADAYLDGVRPGLMLYGYSPFEGQGSKKEVSVTVNSVSKEFSENKLTLNTDTVLGLRPAMKVKTEILSLRRLKKGTPVSYGRTFITARESLIAVLPVGYADGYSRAFSNNSEVIVRGRRVPVIGRVCMDLTMVDVTDVGGVDAGDEVILLGVQGDETITASELASRAGTISYEVLTSLGSKSRRVYLKC